MSLPESIRAQLEQLDSMSELDLVLSYAFARRAALAQRSNVVSIAPADASDLVDCKVAARLLGVSPTWLRHRPDLPFRRKFGGHVRFSRKGIAEWIKRDHHEVA